ncbi:hypothetical protein LQ567_08075 [Niabella pedocola]|uniref:Uncharacterized protein n=1 Tax=Niabella pedocola TaxID=1752077 RepID=A0ABS8PNN1_9BACT|nr:hypothetical protein [Niabella pedocola]MCD2422714.1 hypothetical protein [Niabella pedocola]
MMKKTVGILMALAGTSGAAFSQTEKGSFLTRFSVGSNKATLNWRQHKYQYKG